MGLVEFERGGYTACPVIRHRVLAIAATVIVAPMIWAAAPASADDTVYAGTFDTLPPGAIDCSPRDDGSPIPPGVARTATSFDLGPIITALGPYASLAIFYVDYGDGTGFGSPGDLKTLGSFPASHVYVNPGDYTVAGFASVGVKTESTYRMVTIAPTTEEPVAATETKGWQAVPTPTTTSLVSVEASKTRGALSVGTAVSKIMLPALTFSPTGTYPVQLRLANGTSRYVRLKVT